MDLVVFHFHLNRGGVTQVIVNQLKAIAAAGRRFDRVVVLYGGRANGWPEVPADVFAGLSVETVVIDALEYDSLREGRTDIAEHERQLIGGVRDVLKEKEIRPGSSLVHFHNHALGKNTAAPSLLRELASAGYPVLAQLHDFAEDFRPDAYQHLTKKLGSASRPTVASQLYPQAPLIHYAVLNGRDRQALEKLGVSPSRLHWLPNPVGEFGPLPDRASARRKLGVDQTRRVILYPVRGIRRKNLGEFVLYAALFRDTCDFVLSLAPQNPAERASYDRWCRLADALQLPIIWDSGARLTLNENLAACDAVITTSVAEGFGMVFLEAWLAGKSLFGRDLPEITGDFRRERLDLGNLMSSLRVPIAWFAAGEIVEPLRRAFSQLCDAYEVRPLSPDELDLQLNNLVTDDWIDFAFLASDLQQRVIRRVVEKPEALIRLVNMNPKLPRLTNLAYSNDATIGQNANAVVTNYGSDAFCGRWNQIVSAMFDSVAPGPMQGPTHETAMLSRYLRPARMQPIRFE